MLDIIAKPSQRDLLAELEKDVTFLNSMLSHIDTI
jgi:hypothetical protein